MNQSRKQIFTYLFVLFNDFMGLSLVISIFAPLILKTNSPLIAAHTSLFARNATLGLLTMVYPLAQFFGAPLFGSLSDLHGRKKIMQATVAGSCLSYVLTALSILYGNIVWLFISRIIAGFFAGNVTLCQAGIGDISTAETRVKNFSQVTVAGSVAYIIGPFLGARFSNPNFFSWGNDAAPFWIASILFAITLILIHFNLTESHAKNKEIKMNLLQGFQSLSLINKIPNMKPLFATYFIARTGLWLFFFFFSAFMVQKFNFNQTQAADAFLILSAWTMLIQNTFVKWSKRWFSTYHLVAIFALILGGSTAWITLTASSASIYWIMPLWCLGNGGFYTYYLSYLSEKAGSENQGKSMGVAMSLQSLAQIVAPLVAGFTMASHVNLPMLIGAGMAVLAGLYFLKAVRP